jgi:hypothetical protein
MDATDRAYQTERAFIGECGSIPALLDRMADYRDAQRVAATRGNTKAQLRAMDLLDLAEDRIIELKSKRDRQVAKPSYRTPFPQHSEPSSPRAVLDREPPEPEPQERHQARPPEPRPMPDEGQQARADRRSRRNQERLLEMQAELEHAQEARLREERLRREARERAEAAEQESMRLAALRSQLRREREAQERAARERQAAEQAAAVKERQARVRAVRVERALEEQRRQEALERRASRERRGSVDAAVLQRVQEAVDAPAEVSSPRELRAASAESQPGPSPTASTPVNPPRQARPQEAKPGTASAGPQPEASYTGADIIRFREEHSLTQRAAAERLGVAHGTVAKAERAPDKPLGPTLQEAMGRLIER